MSTINIVAVVVLAALGIASVAMAMRRHSGSVDRTLRLLSGAGCLGLAFFGCITEPNKILVAICILMALVGQLSLAWRSFRASRSAQAIG
jgi:hypothetical protein